MTIRFTGRKLDSVVIDEMTVRLPIPFWISKIADDISSAEAEVKALYLRVECY